MAGSSAHFSGVLPGYPAVPNSTISKETRIGFSSRGQALRKVLPGADSYKTPERA